MTQSLLFRRFLSGPVPLPREATAKPGPGRLGATRPLPRQLLRRLQPRQQARHKRCQSKRGK